MSTSFDVFPTKDVSLSFKDLIFISMENLHYYLDSVDIEYRPDVRFEVRKNSTDSTVHADLNTRLTLSEDNYAWFYVDGVEGGTDVYFWKTEDSEFEELTESLDNAVTEKKEYWVRVYEEAKMYGYNWHFRRGAGQPCIINLMYGVISASLAKLTDGFLYTGDGAWDYERFPASADDFLSWYFYPEKAIDVDYRNWSAECINEISKELNVW